MRKGAAGLPVLQLSWGQVAATLIVVSAAMRAVYALFRRQLSRLSARASALVTTWAAVLLCLAAGGVTGSRLITEPMCAVLLWVLFALAFGVALRWSLLLAAAGGIANAASSSIGKAGGAGGGAAMWALVCAGSAAQLFISSMLERTELQGRIEEWEAKKGKGWVEAADGTQLRFRAASLGPGYPSHTVRPGDDVCFDKVTVWKGPKARQGVQLTQAANIVVDRRPSSAGQLRRVLLFLAALGALCGSFWLFVGSHGGCLPTRAEQRIRLDITSQGAGLVFTCRAPSPAGPTGAQAAPPRETVSAAPPGGNLRGAPAAPQLSSNGSGGPRTAATRRLPAPAVAQ
eukprot:TRINITY_DN60585_c0_g1_i1.p1 TRINITY_DN60585_c0_g1~~TRINITY_DN60585_c0_g1_i1.p1  ORF type:complete len:344 (+),score=51.34 TRINITY_DN60585_c0_g1_i1:153-1184(+)